MSWRGTQRIFIFHPPSPNNYFSSLCLLLGNRHHVARYETKHPDKLNHHDNLTLWDFYGAVKRLEEGEHLFVIFFIKDLTQLMNLPLISFNKQTRSLRELIGFTLCCVFSDNLFCILECASSASVGFTSTSKVFPDESVSAVSQEIDCNIASSAHTVPEGRPSSCMCLPFLKRLSRDNDFQPCSASASAASSRSHIRNNAVSSSSSAAPALPFSSFNIMSIYVVVKQYLVGSCVRALNISHLLP